MKKQLLGAFALWLAMAACGDDEIISVSPTERGTVTDDAGNVYGWVRIGGLDWTTSNAKNGPSCAYVTYVDIYGVDIYVFGDSYGRKDEEQISYMEQEYIPEYGNLMSYEAALASPPEGWRLPTDEDWKNLERALGMDGDPDGLGWRGHHVATLMMQEEEGTQLSFRLGGGIIWTASFGLVLDFMHFKEYGYYWTSTIEPSYTDFQAAYYRKLCYGQGGIERQAAKTNRYFSVRWVRDAK